MCSTFCHGVSQILSDIVRCTKHTFHSNTKISLSYKLIFSPSDNDTGGNNSSKTPSNIRIEFGSPNVVLNKLSIFTACKSLITVMLSLFSCDEKCCRMLRTLVTVSSLSFSLRMPSHRIGT